MTILFCAVLLVKLLLTRKYNRETSHMYVLVLVSILYKEQYITNCLFILVLFISAKDGSKVTTVVATSGMGPDRQTEVSYTDAKVIGNGSFGVVYQAKLVDSSELVAIKKVLQDKRFKVQNLYPLQVSDGIIHT